MFLPRLLVITGIVFCVLGVLLLISVSRISLLLFPETGILQVGFLFCGAGLMLSCSPSYHLR